MLKERYGSSKCDEKLLSLEESLEECSTSSAIDEPQVILPKGLMDHTTSTLSMFCPEGLAPTIEFMCVLPFSDGDARRT